MARRWRWNRKEVVVYSQKRDWQTSKVERGRRQQEVERWAKKVNRWWWTKGYQEGRGRERGVPRKTYKDREGEEVSL